MHKRSLVILVFSLIISVGLTQAKEMVLIDSFDQTGLWGPAIWENNSGEVQLSKLNVSDGKFSLMMRFKESTEFTKSIMATEEPMDLNGVDELYLDIYSESAGMNFMSLACVTGPQWEWHESKMISLVPGWNRNIKVRMSGHFWKALRTEWVHRAELRNRQDVRRIALCFWGKGGTVYVDNLRGTGKDIKPLKTVFENDMIVWESFEKKTKDWVKAPWKNKIVNVTTSKQNVSDGELSLKMDFQGITSTASAAASYDFKGDWSTVKKISMDIYNDTGMWMKFSFVVITGEKWKWNESTCRFLSPGWNRNVCFDLDEPRFKNEDSDWKNSAYLESKNGIQRIGLSLLGMSAEPGISGSVYIDNIRAENNADTAADGRK